MRARTVNESLDFQRGQSPKKATGTGMREVINRWLEETHDFNLDTDPLDVFKTILDDEELTDDIKKRWVSFLIQTNHNDCDWDENDWYEFQSNGIDAVSLIPNGFSNKLNDLLISKNNNSWTIEFSDESEFMDFYEENNDYKEGIEKILSGDGFDVFISSSDDYEITEVAEFILDNKMDFQKTPFDNFMNRYIDLGGNGDNNTEQVLDDIASDEDFSDLNYILRESMARADADTRENNAFIATREAIRNFYNIDVKWSEESSKYIGSIDVKDVHKLFDRYHYEGEGWSIPTSYNNFSGTIKSETFIDELENLFN